jgi:hypothetical protein
MNALLFNKDFNEKFKLSRSNDLYVLGDDSYIYVALDQLIPPYISYYSESILYSQDTMVTWLLMNKPQYVIWNKDNLTFDLVPNILRVPLIYDYIQRNYSFESNFHNFKVLKISFNSLTDPNLSEWTHYLGSSIDLKYLPSFSSISENYNKCSKAKPTNTLLIKSNSKTNGEVVVNFKYKNMLYSLKFNTVPSKQYYFINLERIWFYKFFISQDDLIIYPNNSLDELEFLKCNVKALY